MKCKKLRKDKILNIFILVYLISQTTVEQGALMFPNSSGKLEDLVTGCVCVV